MSSPIAGVPLDPTNPSGPSVGGQVISRKSAEKDNARKQSWLEYVHPFYHEHADRWAYSRDYYTGNVVSPSLVKAYLIQRAFGESDDQYAERVKLSDYTNHFAQVVESLAGRLFAVEGDANRTFMNDKGYGLGDPSDHATPIGRLWRRATPEGDGYLTAWKQLAIELCVSHFAWVMVDVVGTSPILRVFPPSMVTNWLEGPNGPELVMVEEVDNRGSLSDAPVFSAQFLHAYPGGWQRYVIDATGNAAKLLGETDSGTWHYETPEGAPALPIFRVQLPMKRNVGYLLAKKAAAIFNMESSRDNVLRTANHPRFILAASDDQFNKITDALAAGANAVQEDPNMQGQGHRFAAPSPESAKIATDVLAAKVKDFHETAHRDYNDAAPAKRTATQVRQDVQSGEGAFLQLLKAGLDDAENNALWRIEQALNPTDKRYWFVSHVERSDNFMPNDPDAVLEKSVGLVFGAGKSVPVGRAAKLALVKEVATQRSLEFDEYEAAAAIGAEEIEMAIANASANGIAVPDSVQLAMFLCSFAAAGLLDAEKAMELVAGIAEMMTVLVQTQPALKTATTALPKASDPSDGGGASAGVDTGAGGVAGNGIDPTGSTVPMFALAGATTATATTA